MDVRGKKRTPQLFNPVHCLAHPHSNHRPSLRLRYRDASLEFHVCGLWIWAGNRKHGQAAVAPSALFSWNNWSYNWFLEHHKEIMGFFFFFFFLDPPGCRWSGTPSLCSRRSRRGINISLSGLLFAGICMHLHLTFEALFFNLGTYAHELCIFRWDCVNACPFP